MTVRLISAGAVLIAALAGCSSDSSEGSSAGLSSAEKACQVLFEQTFSLDDRPERDDVAVQASQAASNTNEKWADLEDAVTAFANTRASVIGSLGSGATAETPEEIQTELVRVQSSCREVRYAGGDVPESLLNGDFGDDPATPGQGKFPLPPE